MDNKDRIKTRIFKVKESVQEAKNGKCHLS